MRLLVLFVLTLALAGTAPAPTPAAAAAPGPGPGPGPASTPPGDAPDTAAAARLLDSARVAFDEGDFATAAGLFDQTRDILPASPEVLYNLGVARYRNGEYEQAAKRFEEAYGLAEGEDLRSSSLFNLGNAAYAQSEAALDQEAGAGPAMDQLDVASKHIGDALERYRDVLDADSADEDAKVNGETAWRLLEQIRKMQEQLQQQQQQQQDQQQDQQDQQDQQEQQEQDQQQEQQSGEDEQDQQQQDQQQQDQDEQQQQQQQEEEQQQQDQPQPQPGEEQQEQEEQPMPQPSETKEPPMTEDEARRLLQMVRDKEQQRREEQAELRAASDGKVDKDW